MKTNIILLHLHPIEYYPPIQNLIGFLCKRCDCNQQISVITTKHNNHLKSFSPGSSSNISIQSYTGVDPKSGKFTRIFMYARLYLKSLYFIIKKKPQAVLYFETFSALPALVYKCLFKSKVKIMVHYHEYVTPQEYSSSMILSYLTHKAETILYPKMKWISHTNQDRMDKFKADLNKKNLPNTFILPNYPPFEWKNESKVFIKKDIYKIVYVGALSIHTMFVKEICEWVGKHQDKFLLDIYSYNYDKDTSDYLSTINFRNINFYPGVNYDELPSLLQKYDIGVILYKGHLENYIYNAPNKLFEYLACGLDVWFPKEMLGMYEYITTNTYPKVIKIDFEDLNRLDIISLLNLEGLKKKETHYYCESILPLLVEELTN